MRLIFATHNAGKIAEMQQMLSVLGVEVVSATDVGVTEEVDETGDTFTANALLKARDLHRRVPDWVAADDSGLCIAALNGQPGIYSARWAGKEATGDQIVAYTLEQLKNVPVGQRQAYFESDVALIAPDGTESIFTGQVHGQIATEPLGIAHPKLPYDQIFIPDGYTQTFAEMSGEQKNSMSHRGWAFRQVVDFLKQQTQ